jgi:palmitoyltransferase ZDHHC13/17
MNKWFGCGFVQPAQDNSLTTALVEAFEKEKWEEIPKIEDHCLTCQIERPKRSKHCRFLNRCVLNYDHYCYFLSKPIGKNNRRLFFFGLLVHYLSVALFLFLVFLHLNESIPAFEHISSFSVRLLLQFCEQNGPIKLFSLLSIVVWWYNLWYLLLEGASISQGLTVNEVLHRHRYRYLFVPFLSPDDTVKMKYQNPFSKGLLQNWADFLVE